MPSPAPSIEALHEFETQIESAVVALMTAKGVPCIPENSAAYIADTTTRVQVSVGAGLHKTLTKPGDATSLAYTVYAGSIVIMVVTDRLKHPELHSVYVGKARSLGVQFSQLFNSENLEWLAIRELDPVQSPRVQIQDKNGVPKDGTAIEFAIKFEIRRSAWPV